MGIKVPKDRFARLADILGCKASALPSSYLGLPICIGAVSASLWNTVLERLEKKLSLWEANYLSFGGRITLIKAALANFQFTLCRLFKCPAEVIKIQEN